MSAVTELEVAAACDFIAEFAVKEDDAVVDVLAGTGKQVHDVLPVGVELMSPMRENKDSRLSCLGPGRNPLRLVRDSFSWYGRAEKELDSVPDGLGVLALVRHRELIGDDLVEVN
jgi:hypothetical protein